MKVLEHTSDETVGVFETDTLTLAMGLLTAVLSQPHKVGYTQHWTPDKVWSMLTLANNACTKTLGVKLLKLHVESGCKCLAATLRTFSDL